MNKWVLYSLILFVSLISIAVSCTIDTPVSEVSKNPISETDSALVKVYDLLNSESTQLNSVTSTDSLSTSYYSIILDDCPWLIPKINQRFEGVIHSYNRSFEISSSPNNSVYHSILASKHYDKIHYNQDSCFHYARLAYEKVKGLDDDHLLKYLGVCQLIRASEYQRNSLLAVGVENEFLTNAIDVDHPFYQTIFQRRIISLIKLSQLEDAQKEFDKMSSESSDSCSYAISKKLECQLLYSMYNTKDFSIVTEDVISQIEILKSKCNYYDINFDRIIGQYYKQKGLPLKAIDKLIQAKSFEEKKLNYNNAHTETIHFVLSQLYEVRGEYDKAINIYLSNNSEKVSKFIDNPESTKDLNINDLISIQRIADIKKSSGILNKNLSELSKAKSLYSSALRMMNHTLNKYDEETLLRYFHYQTDIVSQLIDINLVLLKSTKQDSLEYEIADLVLIKNNLRYKYEQQFNIQLSQSDPTLLSTIRQNELQLKQESLGELIESKNLYELSVNQLNLKRKFPKLSALDPSSLDHKNRFSKTIGSSHEPWLIFSFLDDRLIQLIWRDQKLDISEVYFSERDFNQLDSLIKFQSDVSLDDPDRYQSLAHHLYNKLIPKSLFDVQHLRLILDGPLNYVSFDALVTNDDHIEHFSELEYLIKETNTRRHFIEELYQNSNNTVFDTYAFSFSNNKTVLSPKTRLSELFAGISETKIIADISKSNKLFRAQDCTKQNFKNALKRENINIHLATHGYANAQERDQLKLYFRNKDLSLDSMFAYELLESQINAHQIILSACETAYGKTETVEGVYNWPRYLLQQGAQSIISTLWLLSDVSGSEIFKHYYTQGSDLHQAKLNYLTEGKYPAQPYYWAGLVEY